MMTCIEFRQLVGADPASRDPEVLRHRLECRACSEFAAAHELLNRQLFRALAIDVPEEMPARVMWRAASDRAVWQRWGGIAAMLLLSLGLGVGFWSSHEQKTLSSELVAHFQHEPDLLLQTDRRAAPRRVSAVLDRGGFHAVAELKEVSHAGLCPFHGRLVPHLVMVVDGEAVSVLLLQNESVPGVETIDEDGFHGVIVPSRKGSMAIVAARPDLIEPVQTQLESAVRPGI